MYLTRKEASARLGLSVSTLFRLERAGVLKPYKLGAGDVKQRRTSYLLSDVEEYERRAAVEASAVAAGAVAAVKGMGR